MGRAKAFAADHVLCTPPAPASRRTLLLRYHDANPPCERIKELFATPPAEASTGDDSADLFNAESSEEGEELVVKEGPPSRAVSTKRPNVGISSG